MGRVAMRRHSVVADPGDRAAVVEQLRARLAAVPGSAPRRPLGEEPAERAPDRRGLAAATVRVASAAVADPSRILPVADPLAPLLPEGGLRRGSVVALVSGPGELPLGSGAGMTSLLLALLSRASVAGSWSAVVGVPGLGALAAAQAGVDLARLALIPTPGPNLTGIAAALLDGVELLALAGPERLSAPERSRLSARARQCGSVLLPLGVWPGADVVLRCSGARWLGPPGVTGSGANGPGGRLRQRELLVSAGGRRTSAPVSVRLLLPSGAGPVRTASQRTRAAPAVPAAVAAVRHAVAV